MVNGPGASFMPKSVKISDSPEWMRSWAISGGLIAIGLDDHEDDYVLVAKLSRKPSRREFLTVLLIDDCEDAILFANSGLAFLI